MAIDKMASLAVPQMSFPRMCGKTAPCKRLTSWSGTNVWPGSTEAEALGPFACQFFKRNAMSSKSTRLGARLPLLGPVAGQDVGHPIVAFVTGNFVQRAGRPVH